MQHQQLANWADVSVPLSFMFLPRTFLLAIVNSAWHTLGELPVRDDAAVFTRWSLSAQPLCANFVPLFVSVAHVIGIISRGTCKDGSAAVMSTGRWERTAIRRTRLRAALLRPLGDAARDEQEGGKERNRGNKTNVALACVDAGAAGKAENDLTVRSLNALGSALRRGVQMRNVGTCTISTQL